MSNIFKEFRESNGFSRKEAGQLIGVSEWSWSNAEKGNLRKNQEKKYENAVRFIDRDLFKPVDPDKLTSSFFRSIKNNQLLALTGFTEDAFSSSRSKIKTKNNIAVWHNVFLNAAIFAIEEEKNRRKKTNKIPEMEINKSSDSRIELVQKKTYSIADQIVEIVSRNEQLEGENSFLKLTISTLELQIKQQTKEIEHLKSHANIDNSALMTPEQKKYLTSIVIRFAEKSSGGSGNNYYNQAFWTDIHKHVGVKSVNDIKTFNQWMKATRYAKQRCKDIGLNIESFPFQLSIVN